jgi:hypothetical protein
MPNEQFSTDGAPGYLEYAGRHQHERVSWNMAFCDRMEVRETRAEFHVQNVEFIRNLDSDKWREVERTPQTICANPREAIEWIKQEHEIERQEFGPGGPHKSLENEAGVVRDYWRGLDSDERAYREECLTMTQASDLIKDWLGSAWRGSRAVPAKERTYEQEMER